MRSTISALVVALVVALLIPVWVNADDPPQRIRVSELEKTLIPAGPLKIRLTKFRGSFLKLGNGSIEVEVENSGSNFETFSPLRLALVDRDNKQVNILSPKRNSQRAVPPFDTRFPTSLLDRRIAPGARIKESYTLSGKVHLPIRLYYDEKHLADIVD